MHITMLALGSTGDILPYTALGKGLVDAGYQVRFATFQAFESPVLKRGMEFHRLPGDPRTLVAEGGTNIFSMASSFGSLAREYTKALSVPELLDTDLVINQLPGGMFGSDLAEKAGVQMIQAAVIPLVPTDEFPMMGFPDLPLPGSNRLSYTLADIAAWGLFRKEINRWRQEDLGLTRISRKNYFNSDQPVLNGFSPAVVNRPPEWGKQVYTTGYWFPEDPDWQPPVELERFLDDGPAPVFIGFGSLPVINPEKTTAKILEALRRTGMRAVLGTGWAGLGKDDLPESVYPLSYAPYQWLFPKMDLVIHHGGSGTTGFGLQAGIPSCAIGLGFDQLFWGERIAALGAGPPPLHQRKITARRLVDIIHQGVYNESMRRQAREIGRIIRQEDGIGTGVRIVRNLLGA